MTAFRARRHAFLAGIACIAVAAAGCGTDGATGSRIDPTLGDRPSHAAGATQGARVATALVPEGSAVIVAGDRPYVIAQPAAGKYIAFDATCAESAGTVAADDGLVLTCAEDGSVYDGATGAVSSGPATDPLTEVPVRLDGQTLIVG